MINKTTQKSKQTDFKSETVIDLIIKLLLNNNFPYTIAIVWNAVLDRRKDPQQCIVIIFLILKLKT